MLEARPFNDVGGNLEAMLLRMDEKLSQLATGQEEIVSRLTLLDNQRIPTGGGRSSITAANHAPSDVSWFAAPSKLMKEQVVRTEKRGDLKSSTLKKISELQNVHRAGPDGHVDVVLFNDEIDMLAYRLQLHSPIASHFLIVESNVTHVGQPKPLHGARALAVGGELFHLAERLQGRLTVLNVPGLDRRKKYHWPHYWRETAMRVFVNSYLQRHFPNYAVFMSDVDELLDSSMQTHFQGVSQRNRCIRPKLYGFYYGEHCACLADPNMGERSVYFHTNSTFFAQVVARKAELRYSDELVSSTCPVSTIQLGWHLSYFFDTPTILVKLQSFRHADDVRMRRLLELPNRSAVIDDRISRCASLLTPLHPGRSGKLYVTKLTEAKWMSLRTPTLIADAWHGQPPPINNWPRHPRAPFPPFASGTAVQTTAAQGLTPLLSDCVNPQGHRFRSPSVLECEHQCTNSTICQGMSYFRKQGVKDWLCQNHGSCPNPQFEENLDARCDGKRRCFKAKRYRPNSNEYLNTNSSTLPLREPRTRGGVNTTRWRRR